ncbi:MAG TPA: DUF1634 domain-containing protein [Candidatus Saccharimonadales bacterium]|nr:DUF1634 domain-containing protein [Candidatus Saccharimonadales bacterium]
MSGPRAVGGTDIVDLDRLIGRLLVWVTYAAVTLLVIGVLLMILDGISPLAGGPPLDPGTLVAGLIALEPAAFLWLGLLAVIATPVSRVIVAGVSFARRGDRTLAAISFGIIVVIIIGVVTALVSEA